MTSTDPFHYAERAQRLAEEAQERCERWEQVAVSYRDAWEQAQAENERLRSLIVGMLHADEDAFEQARTIAKDCRDWRRTSASTLHKLGIRPDCWSAGCIRLGHVRRLRPRADRHHPGDLILLLRLLGVV